MPSSVDADMDFHASQRGRVVWTDSFGNENEVTLIAWRPHRVSHGRRHRTFKARIQFDNQRLRTVSASDISPAKAGT